MQLNKIQIETRQRNPWEAIDLGFLLARQWFLPMFLSWLIPAAIIFTVLAIVFNDHIYIAFFTLWWLKPLWDRGPLIIVSQRLFGDVRSPEKVLSDVWWSYRHRWWQSLTYGRFSFTRSFDLPVLVLERIKGKQASKRHSVLHRFNSNAAVWLTITALHIEAILMAGLFFTVAAFLPESWQIDFLADSSEVNTAGFIVLSLSQLLAMALVGPFYSAAGFVLYISRRIELEAWDIELRFKALAQRLKSAASALLLLVFCAVGCVSVPNTVVADEQLEMIVDSLQASNEDSLMDELAADYELALSIKQQIQAIVEGDDFHQKKTITTWEPKNPPEEKELDTDALARFFEAIFSVFKFLKPVGEVLGLTFSTLPYIVMALGALLVAYLVYQFRHLVGSMRVTGADMPEQRPTVMFGMDVSVEALPDDIASAVQACIQAGNYRAGLSLLYRAALSHAMDRFNVPFKDSDTELQCVRRVVSTGQDNLQQLFQQLTQHWLQLAYAHRPITAHDLEQLLAQWQQVFDE